MLISTLVFYGKTKKEIKLSEDGMEWGIKRIIIFTVTFSVFLVSIFLLIGCSQKNDKSLIEQINNIPESEDVQEIYHIEVIDSGFLVFYRSNNGLRTGILNQNKDWITKSGDASLAPDEGLSVHFANREEIQYFSYGVVTNPDIVEVMSTKNNNVNTAKIIQTTKGLKYGLFCMINQLNLNFLI